MRFSTRGATITLRLLLLSPVVLAFQNCNSKMGTDSSVSGDMTTHISLDQTQLKLEDLVRSYYVNVLGRQPTDQELATALAALRAGLPGSSLQTQLATSGESIAKLSALLLQALGSSNGTNLNQLVSLLSSGTTLQQIKQLLGLPVNA